jgi:hypothetical protein
LAIADAGQTGLTRHAALPTMSSIARDLTGRIMTASERSQSRNRFQSVTKEKAEGATYTPKMLADFVAQQIVGAIR